jgi:hypothetical protein
LSAVGAGITVSRRRRSVADPAAALASWPLPGLSLSADSLAAVGNCAVTPASARFLLKYLTATRQPLLTLALRPADPALLDAVVGSVARDGVHAESARASSGRWPWVAAVIDSAFTPTPSHRWRRRTRCPPHRSGALC